MINYKLTILTFFLIGLYVSSLGQNPLIRDQFTADPSACVFNGKVYVYPSHDIANMGKGRENWFCMEDYHVFSSENLTQWTDHGVIVSQQNVPWVDTSRYAMWAPDCIEKKGKYYFYFPAINKDTSNRNYFGIGVAIADKPEGPFSIQPKPIKDVHGIDPNVFIDNDGQAYLYWSHRDFSVAKLKDNMLELDSEIVTIENLPNKGLKEGPYLFERNGLYYLTYPHVENKTERLEYAIGKSPTGPFTVTGVIMDESPDSCWTNHHSIINYNNQWYLFYHHNDYSPSFDKNRSIRMDSLFFNEDGTIQKVTPTLRGAGLTSASSNIQIDRYSMISKTGVEIVFIDTSNTFAGWKTILSAPNSWVQYNAVDFRSSTITTAQIKAKSAIGSEIEIRVNNADGKLISKISIPKSNKWEIINADINYTPTNVENLVCIQKSKEGAEIDYITFK